MLLFTPPYFIKFIIASLKFLTIWNIILIVFYKYTSEYIDLHLLSLVVALVSSGIFYVQPKYLDIIVDGKKIVFSVSKQTVVFYFLDFLFHWLPLIVVLMIVPLQQMDERSILTIVILYFYLISANALQDVYRGISLYFTFLMVILAVFIRYLITFNASM